MLGRASGVVYKAFGLTAKPAVASDVFGRAYKQGVRRRHSVSGDSRPRTVGSSRATQAPFFPKYAWGECKGEASRRNSVFGAYEQQRSIGYKALAAETSSHSSRSDRSFRPSTLERLGIGWCFTERLLNHHISSLTPIDYLRHRIVQDLEVLDRMRGASGVHLVSLAQSSRVFSEMARPCLVLFGGGGIPKALSAQSGLPTVSISRKERDVDFSSELHFKASLTPGELTPIQKLELVESLSTFIVDNGINDLKILNNVGLYSQDKDLDQPGKLSSTLLQATNSGYHQNLVAIVDMVVQNVLRKTGHLISVSIATIGTNYRTSDDFAPCRAFAQQKEICDRITRRKGYYALTVNTGLISTEQFARSADALKESSAQSEKEVAETLCNGFKIMKDLQLSALSMDTYKALTPEQYEVFAKRELARREGGPAV